MLVAGVDGCRKGWLVVLAHASENLSLASITVEPDFSSVMGTTATCTAVAVDMPIGLQGSSRRGADQEARRLLGWPRSTSVLPSPLRTVLAAASYKEACDLSRAGGGFALPRESYGLLAKVRQVDAALMPAMQSRVKESHPELSFAALNQGVAFTAGKRTGLGAAQRREALSRAWKENDFVDQVPHGASPDDLLDAAARAWAAQRISRGESVSLPIEEERDERGLRVEIVF